VGIATTRSRHGEYSDSTGSGRYPGPKSKTTKRSVIHPAVMTCERTHDVTRSDEIRAQTPIPTKQMATNAAIAPQNVSAKLPVLKKRRQERRDQPADDDQRTADSWTLERK
jgi:hypothetical protein